MVAPADLLPGSMVHESSPLSATAKLMTKGGLTTARGLQHRRRCPLTLHRGRKSTCKTVTAPTMLPHQWWHLDIGGRRQQRSQISDGGVAAERGGVVREGLWFGSQTCGLGEDKVRKREANARCPAVTQTRPRFGPAFGRPRCSGHPFWGCVRTLGHGFVRFDPAGRTGAG
jgi:hypothetical protein